MGRTHLLFARVLRNRPGEGTSNRIQDSLGFHLEWDRQAKELPFAQRQQIELVRMLYRGAEILILDEPTSLLSPGETEKFLDLMKSLRAGGRTVLFISHRLVEVFSVADRITVLRGGSLEATLDAGGTDIEEIARLMAGGASEQGPATRSVEVPPSAAAGAAPFSGTSRIAWRRGQSDYTAAAPCRLEIRNLSVGPSGTEPALRDISISIGKGEIFGIGGIVGNGQRSLARVLAGKTRPDSGWVRFEGEEISRLDIKERLRKNILWLPENPVEEALLPERPLWENFLLGRQREKEFAQAGFIRKQKIIGFSRGTGLAENIAAPVRSNPSRAFRAATGRRLRLPGSLPGRLSWQSLSSPAGDWTFTRPGVSMIACWSLAATGEFHSS